MTEPYVDDKWVAREILRDAVTPRWVRENVPGVRLSPRKIVFLESEVRAWLKQRETKAA